MGLLNKHDDNRKESLKKSEKNLHGAKLGDVQHTYSGYKGKKHKEYATLRTDKDIICKLKALRNFFGDHNVGITLNRMLDSELPKVLTDNKKKIFFEGLLDSFKKSIGSRSNK